MVPPRAAGDEWGRPAPMATLSDLLAYTNEFLNAPAFKDYAPNGLQVQGREELRRIVTGVTASRALIEAAVAAGADALLVHHGYFWRGEDPCLTGIKRERVRRLLAADVSLIAYHLPLDAHPGLGNNARLGELLGIEVSGALNAEGIGLHGVLPEALSAEEFSERIARVLDRVPLHLPGGPAAIRRVGWCTGAAQDYIDQAVALGLDAYVSGEVSERTTHTAAEAGIHYFAAGHHATERYGIQALGEHLAQRFGLEHRFIDSPNPV